jgi:hypothetical protein
MTYKPHLSILLPIALLANRQWLALAGFIMGSTGLIAGSLIVFGADIWIVYIKNFFHATHVLQSGGAPLYKAPTFYAFFTLLGADVVTARIFQAAFSLSALASIVWLWSRPTEYYAEKSAGLVIAIFLFTPSAYDYDLAILSIPIALMAREIMMNSKFVYEKWVLVSMWALPLIYPIIASVSSVQIGPFMLALFFGLVLFRATRPASGNIA